MDGWERKLEAHVARGRCGGVEEEDEDEDDRNWAASGADD